MNIKILQEKISNNHNDSTWYDGTIAEVIKPNGTELNLIACGEIRIYNKEGYLVFDGKIRNGGIKGGFNSDKDLKKIGNSREDDYYWDMNNWFEVIFKEKGEKHFDFDIGNVVYEYDDGLELLKSYVECEDY